MFYVVRNEFLFCIAISNRETFSKNENLASLMLFTIVRLNRLALADCDFFKEACPSIKFVYLDWLTSYL